LIALLFLLNCCSLRGQSLYRYPKSKASYSAQTHDYCQQSSLCIAQCGKCSFLMYRNWGSPRNELQQGEHCPLHYIHNLHFQHLTHSIVRSSGDPTAVLPTSEGGYLYQPLVSADCIHHTVVMTTETTLNLQYYPTNWNTFPARIKTLPTKGIIFTCYHDLKWAELNLQCN